MPGSRPPAALAGRRQPAAPLLIGTTPLRRRGEQPGILPQPRQELDAGRTVLGPHQRPHDALQGVAAVESGSALNFTGDTTSSMMIPDAASLHLTKGMTLEAWVNPATLAGHGNNGAAVIAKDFMIPSNHNKFSDKDPISYALYASDGNNKPPAVHILVGGTDYEVKGTSKISTNQWTFLAATFDGTTLSLYVNGTLAGSQAIQGTILNSTDPLRIGGDWAGEMFTGLIDNVRISRMALPQSEILTEMNAPVISVQDPEGGSGGRGPSNSLVRE